jgi:lysophospholipase L1-like esterase
MLRKTIITACLVHACVLVLQSVQAQEEVPTIGLIGDSTVANTYGWGPAFAAELNGKAKVLNYAKNGATLDSLSKTLDKLIESKPSFILIQFGHNDMKRYDADAYGRKLKDYLERIRHAGSKAVVLSSVTRRSFDGNGKIEPAVIKGRTLAEYAQAARKTAHEMEVPFIDLNSISIKHHNKIGPEESATYNFKADDRTHFSKKGAKEIAVLIIDELKISVPGLAEHLK